MLKSWLERQQTAKVVSGVPEPQIKQTSNIIEPGQKHPQYRALEFFLASLGQTYAEVLAGKAQPVIVLA